MRRLIAVAVVFVSAAAAGSARAAYPGGNGLVAYTAPSAGGTAIFTVADGSTSPTLLLGTEGIHLSDPSWSPDGQKIAYASDAGGGATDIWVADADGSNAVDVTNTPREAEAHPTWSPDGTKIAFSASVLSEGAGNLGVVDADGANWRLLTQSPTSDVQPAWSPDGNTIAFVRQGDGSADILTLDLATGAENAVTKGGDNLEPDWSPDGKAILFTNGNGLWTVPAGGGSPSSVDLDAAAPTNGVFSPDGQKIAFFGGTPAGSGIATGGAGGGAVSLLALDSSADAPTWQPVTSEAPSGALVLTASSDFDTDPAFADTPIERQLAHATCANLVNVGDDPRRARLPVPDAAVSLPSVSADGLTYTFRIRPGLGWSPPLEGALTATAFARALDRVRDPALESPGAALFANVARVDARGDTLAITLREADPRFLADLTSPYACAVPPDLASEPDNGPLASAGPYYVASHDPKADRIVVERNPAYGGSRPQGPETLVYATNVTQESAVTLVERGSADYAAGGVPDDDVERLTTQYGPDSPAAAAGHQQLFTGPNGADFFSARVGCQLELPQFGIDLVDLCLRPGESVDGVSLTATPDPVTAGAARIPISSIDPGQALGRTADDTQSAPLAGIPLAGIPLAGIPLAGIDLRGSPLAGIPLAGIGFDAPTLRAALGGLQLSSIPLRPPLTWDAELAGTPLATALDQETTLADVFDKAPQVVSGPKAVTLADVDFASTPLAGIPLVGIALGPVPLAGIPLAGIPTSDPTALLDEWCKELNALAAGSCASGASLAGQTLMSMALGGAPLAGIPLAGIPLAGIDLTGSPLAGIPLAGIVLEGSPLAGIPLAGIARNSAPLAGIPLAAILVSANGSPLRDIPLTALGDPGTVVDCTATDCNGGTLGAAFDAGALRPNVTLGDIVDALGSYTLGDLKEYDDVTLGDVYRAFPDSVLLGDVLIALLGNEDYPWQDLPLDQLALQGIATGGGSLAYGAVFTPHGAGPTASVAVDVTLPPGFAYVPGSAHLVRGEANAPLADPQVNGRVLHWQVDGAPVGVVNAIRFDARPGLTLGAWTASVDVTPLGGTAATASRQSTVTETFEPNDDPATAPIVQPDSLYVSYVSSRNDVDYYRLPSPPVGSRIEVALGNLKADFDLAVYAPARFQLRNAPAAAPLGSPPLRDPGFGVGSALRALAPDTVQDLPLQGLPLAGVSATQGTASERVDAVSRTSSGYFVIQVTGANGASSSDPYALRITVTPPPPLPPCPVRVFPHAGDGVAGTIPTSFPAGLNTVFLVDKKRLGDTFGASAAGDVMAHLGQLAGRGNLGVVGAVVPVEGDPAVAAAYAAWDADSCSSDRANAVVSAIADVVDRIRQARPTLANVVVVGDDTIVPMARLDDTNSVSNEVDYASTFADGNNEYLGALARGQFLSDDPYGDVAPIPYLDRQLFVPELAVGRLVETPAQITAQLDQFMSSTVNGRLDPKTALTTGYDFLSDGAQEVAAGLAKRVGAANSKTLVNETWTRADLLGALFPPSLPAPGIASLNAHYDHYRALPADQNAAHTENQLFTSTDVAAAGAARLVGRLLFTMGCHAGYSVSDVVIGAADPRAADWAETYANANALFAGNTGYGYGDTAAVAYSERLMALFATNLDGTMSIGAALALAKQRYFSELAAFTPADEKALEEATFYGLPMYRIGATATPPAPPPAPPLGVDPQTGLASSSFSTTPSFTLVSGPTGKYYQAGGGDPQVTPFQPIEPRVTLDVTESGTTAHGALVTAATEADETGFDAAFSRPVVDLSKFEPELAPADAAFPAKLQTVTRFTGPGGPREQLVLTVGQFLSDPAAAPGIGTQRRFTSVAGTVLYSRSADFAPPTVRFSDAVAVDSAHVAFVVDTSDDATAGVKRVVVLYRTPDGVWHPLDLVQSAPGSARWTGGAAVAAAGLTYVVQSVDASGNVGVSSGKGRDLPINPLPGQGPGSAFTSVDGPRGQNGWFVGAVRVGIASDPSLVVSVDGAPFTAPGSSIDVAGDGLHTLEARRVDGQTDDLVVPIDTSGPAIAISSPLDGSVYPIGATVVSSFGCVDSGSGVASCTGTPAQGASFDTSQLGPQSLVVNASDVAGNASRASTTFTVVRPDLGEQRLGPSTDEDAVGLAEAFRTTARRDATVRKLALYVDATSAALRLAVGIYDDSGGHPAHLLAQGTLSGPVNGAWNTFTLSQPVSLVGGRSYWIALLAPVGDAATPNRTVRFRDFCCGGSGPSPSENSAQKTLSALPATWTTGKRWPTDGPITAFAVG